MEQMPCEKFARIIRTDKDTLRGICARMGEITGKKDVLNDLVAVNEIKIKECLKRLELRENASAFKIYSALIKKIKRDDRNIFKLFREPSFATFEGAKTLISFAIESANMGNVFALKKEKAVEFLRRNPPKNIIKNLNYRDVEELLAKEDLFEIFSALRFAEERKWLNEVFFKAYEELKPSDFEERKIELRVLNGKWLTMAQVFLKKKYHNISHLKELGIIYVIPLELKIPGETIRSFALILHYLNEINFYSRLFRKYAEDKKTFAQNLISGLRGDVLDERLPDGKKMNWMLVQRYLAKEDEFDWRLFEPHVNPEAIHWTKAENNLAALSKRFPELELDFWQDLDYVGDFFKTETGIEVLVSFNLIDTAMSLVQEKDMIKYLYHHQEALWNKIFSTFVGEEESERLIIDNFMRGYIQL